MSTPNSPGTTLLEPEPTRRPPETPTSPPAPPREVRMFWLIMTLVVTVVVLLGGWAVFQATTSPEPTYSEYDGAIERDLREHEAARQNAIENASDSVLDRLIRERAAAKQAAIDDAYDHGIERRLKEVGAKCYSPDGPAGGWELRLAADC